eukprot:gene26418-31923_t
MADVFDVEAYLDEQIAQASKSEQPKEGSTKDNEVKRKSSRSRSRSRDRDRRRDSSRDRRKRRSSSRDRRRNRSSSRDRSRRDRDESREKREKSLERRREREERMEAEREAARKEREIDDLTKDQRTIFVSQLTKKVTERDLERFFGQIGKVRSVIMIRDKHSGVHKGFGYVEMADLDTIPNCLLFHNVVPDFQKFPILVKASEAEKNFLAKRDPFNLKNAGDPENDPETRVYIGNIHMSLDENSLKTILEPFGTVESVKIHRDHLGNSKGFAFVKFSTRESAKDCMSRLGGQEIAGRQVKVGPVTDYKPIIPTWGMDGSGPAPPGGAGGAVGGGAAINPHDATANWKLDADEGNAGMSMNSTSRHALMMKLAQGAGMDVPAPPVLPAMPVVAAQPPPVGPPAGIPSPYLKIANMFDMAAGGHPPQFFSEIEEDVFYECERFGKVVKVKADTRSAGGVVYVQMDDVGGGKGAAGALQGRFFAGRRIMVTFIDAMSFSEATR